MKTKPKIAVIGLKGLPAFGGAAAVGENIIDHLKDRYDFTVYSTSSHTDLNTGVYKGYRQVVFKKVFPGKLNSLYYYIASMIHCMFCNYDLIHTHHNISGLIIPVLKLKFRVINTLHSVGEIRENFKNISFIIRLAELFSVNLSNTVTFVAQSTYSNYKVKNKKNIYYIPNGVNIPAPKHIGYINNIDNNYILFAAGRILPSKGCHILLQALQKIKLNKKVIIAGNYSYLKSYSEQLRQLADGLDVDFLGLIKDKNVLQAYIKQADYFVFPSSIEAMSMMLLEVASLNLPIICSDIFENKLIFNEKEVLYFSSGDYTDLAKKISYAEENKHEMLKRAELAYQKVLTQYSWFNISKKYDKIYSELLK